jgi:aspartate beta-hydroxylase
VLGQSHFSIVRAHSRLTPHCGATNLRLTAHLGLVVPEQTYIRVADDTRQWREGKVLVFDDSFDHEVWNDSDEDRIVLLINFWPPDVGESSSDAIVAHYRSATGLGETIEIE